MLLNTFVGKCFGQPQRGSIDDLSIGSEWTTIRKFPGEFLTYLYTGRRPKSDQNRETTQVKLTGLTADAAFAELAWSSVTPLQGSREVDLTESLLLSGLDPSEIAALTPFGLEAIVTMSVSGYCDCSGTALVRMSDGWPQRVAVDRMNVDLMFSWSGPPDDPVLSEETGAVEMILEITGSIDAIS
jgi:hypothetical protein